MAIGAALAIGTVGSALIGSSAAKKAAGQQGDAAEQQLALSREVFATTEANAAPFIDAGTTALDALLFNLGLGEAPLIGGETSFKVGDRTFATREAAEAFTNQLTGGGRELVRAAGVPFGRDDGNVSSTDLFRTTAGSRRGGTIEEITTGGTPGGGFQESPGFEFAFQKGVDAIDASAAAGGNLFSGSTLQDLTKFGIGIGNQEFGSFLSRLQSLVSVGQTGVGQVANAGTVLNQFGGQAIANQGNALSAGTIGSANAFIGGLNNLSTIAGSFGGFSSGSSVSPQFSPFPVSRPNTF